MNEPYDRSAASAPPSLAPPSPEPYSALADSGPGRLLGALFSPAATFRSIAERPTWVLPLLLLIIFSTLVSVVLVQHTDLGATVRQQLEKAGQPATPEQVELGKKIGLISALLGSLIVTPIAYLISALVFWLAFKAVGGEMRFPVSFSVNLHAALPVVVSLLLGLVVLLSHSGLYSPEEMRRFQSQGLLASHLGVLLPDSAGAVLRSLAGSIDLFSIWTLALLVTGYRAATRVSRNAAIGVVLGVWVAYLLVIKVGLAALFAKLQGGG